MKLLTSLLALVAFGGVAFGADEKPAGDKPKRNPEAAFKKLDTNGDGKVSSDEFKAGPMGQRNPDRAEKAFKNRDKDNDGSLSLEEMTAPGKKKDKKES